MSAIDLRSDTVTCPTPAMRRAMAEAVVGDDVYGEDPTVRMLEARAADLVGKEAALFMPSGTMANQVAIRVHTEPGDAMIVSSGAHMYLYEGGGAAALSGVHTVVVGDEGRFTAEEARAAAYPSDSHFARTRLICIENTHNRSGGRIFPQQDQHQIARFADEAGLRLHLDGARIFNAAIASDTSVLELARPFDTVAFCLSKGLGAPVGSMLCGKRVLIERAHRFRKMLGGAMRQAGILAAAGLYALEHNVERLHEDHANARHLAGMLVDVPGVEHVQAPETNIVVFRVEDARAWVERARSSEVLLNAIDSTRIRAVTHLDVSRAQLEVAVGRIRRIAA